MEMEGMVSKKRQQQFRPLCPFCGAEWNDENVQVHDVYASGGCDTCGFGTRYSYTVEIKCHSCGRLMYQKEGEEYPYGC
jgi:hypothetical protein